MPRHAFQLAGRCNELGDGLVRFHLPPQGLGNFYRPIDGDAQFHRHRLGDAVYIRIGDAHHPPYIADHCACSHRSKGNDLADMILPIFFDDVINDLLPAFIAEVYVYIRHGDALRIQKALKEQIVFDRVHIRDPQAVRHHATSCAAAARAHGDALFLGKADIIPHD